MSYTTSQLATAVLQHIGVLDATETIASVDETYITDVWAAKWEEISAHGMEITYFNYDIIPNPVFLTVRDLVANEVRGAFGLPISAAEKEQEEQIILRRLRRHVSTQGSRKPVAVEYM
jgi:hypothetical protein